MRKLAFVVGMSEYPNDRLVNPEKDADSIENSFRKLGIDTIKKTNIGVADFKDALDKFKDDLSRYEVAIFFFAGHGTEIDGENYLCAVDTDFETLNRIQYSSLSLSYLIDLLEKTNTYTKIIILDACRDNPFERRLRSARCSQLAPVFAPLGTIIAYATSPGQVASDGRNGNGAYTYSLLQHIFTNDLKIEEFFKRTRNTLYALTSKKQLSWEHTSLMGDFYFSNSSLTGEFASTYSKEAFADATYNYNTNSRITEVIADLRSCNWDRQNPAIRKINSLDLQQANINELFLLGRNIYQTGVGPAWDAASYLNNIHSNLNKFTEEIRYHILNGLAYEIYFNSSGLLREEFKVDGIDKVYGELTDIKNRNSLEFLESVLEAYDFRFIYRPQIRDAVILYVACEKYKDDVYRVVEITHNSKNILYDNEGTDVYAADDDIILISRDRFKSDLNKRIGAPTYKLQVHFVGLPDNEKDVCAPYAFKLLNYPIRSKK